MSSRAEGAPPERPPTAADVIAALREVYTDDGVELWLHSPNSELGGARPEDLLRDGQVDVVSDAVERLRVGAS